VRQAVSIRTRFGGARKHRAYEDGHQRLLQNPSASDPEKMKAAEELIKLLGGSGTD
jgi:hypothetical protein